MADDAFKKRLENFESAHRPAEAVDTNKINFYTAGLQKKSKREREKEAAEAKRLQEEEDAAKAYRDFVASFDDPSESNGARGHKAFVRAGGSGSPSFAPPAGPSHASQGFRPLGASGSRPPPGNSIAPPTGPRAFNSRAPPSQQPSSSVAASFMDDDGPEIPAPVPQSKKKRAMDSFLDELKRDQDVREQRLQSQVAAGIVTSVSAAAAQDLSRAQGPAAGGSFDTGDPSTTNIHVGNLPANVTVNALGMHFAQFGPVASVKIMWPREQGGANIGMMNGAANFAATRAGLNGFIAFMKRSDAKRAFDKCDNVEWGGSILQLSWGKAMPLPPRPTFVSATPYHRTERSRSPSPSRFKRRSRSRSLSRGRREDSRDRPSKRSRRSGSGSDRSRSRSRSRERNPRAPRWGRSHSRSRTRSYSSDGGTANRRGRSRSGSQSPRERRWPKLDSRELQGRLEDVASKIKQYGKRYEETLRDKERNNPNYDFLRDESLPAFHYFKMLTDRYYRPPAPPPPPFQDDGDVEVMSSDDSELEDQMKHNRRGALGRLPRTKLEAMLRTLNNTRDKVARVMAFALERPDAADEVSDVIIQSLLISSTPVPRKIARLSVISDILHNCAGTPTNAWKYRSLFEAKLPAVFTHLGEIYKSFPGRMKAEVFRKQVMTIMQVWEQWLVFNPSVLTDLEKRLSTGEEGSDRQEDSGSASPAVHRLATTDSPAKRPTAGFSAVKVGRIEESAASAGAAQEEDIDGEELGSGPPTAQAEDMDGEPMDGDAIDGDEIDGAPL